eukprot:6490941-Amphidinium_carterae.2
MSMMTTALHRHPVSLPTKRARVRQSKKRKEKQKQKARQRRRTLSQSWLASKQYALLIHFLSQRTDSHVRNPNFAGLPASRNQQGRKQSRSLVPDEH